MNPKEPEPARGKPAAQQPPSLFADLLGDRMLPRVATMPDVIALVVGFAVASYTSYVAVCRFSARILCRRQLAERGVTGGLQGDDRLDPRFR